MRPKKIRPTRETYNEQLREEAGVRACQDHIDAVYLKVHSDIQAKQQKHAFLVRPGNMKETVANIKNMFSNYSDFPKDLFFLPGKKNGTFADVIELDSCIDLVEPALESYFEDNNENIFDEIDALKEVLCMDQDQQISERRNSSRRGGPQF